MRTWTIQPRPFWNYMQKEIMDNNTVSPNTEVIEDWNGEFLRENQLAYDLIIDRLKKQVKPPNPAVKYPFWHWLWYDGYQNPRPDLRDFRWHIGAAGTEFVRVECDIPKDYILPFSYERWRRMLNKWYLDFLAPKRQREIEEQLEGDNIWESQFPYPEPKYSEINQEVKKSWDRLFVYNYRTYQVIGITWEIRKEWIKKVDYFSKDRRIKENRIFPEEILQLLSN